MIKSAEKKIKSFPYAGKYVPDGKHSDWINEYKKSNSASVKDKQKNQTHREHKIDLSKAAISFSSKKTYQELFDGKLSSLWTANNNKFPFVLLIDLKKKYNLENYQILWGKDSDWYTHSIEVSADNQNWTMLKNDVVVSGQSYALNQIEISKAVRYFRLKISGIRPVTSKVAIREVKLFGLPINNK